MEISAPVTAIVAAWNRIPETLETLRRICECSPAASEIIVHIDGKRHSCKTAIATSFPNVRLLISEQIIGPGGARNRMVEAAGEEIIASFDDDSCPIDRDYFQRVCLIFENFPEVSVIGAAVYERNITVKADARTASYASDFIGCGCAYRRAAFLAAGGYVPLPVAYGMEEVDLALRLHARGHQILRTQWLRVFHDTNLKRHADPKITAASIANLALVAYLRYPVSLWCVGLLQMIRRTVWLIRARRFQGVVCGWFSVPKLLLQYRSYRAKLPLSAITAHLKMRRMPPEQMPF